MSVVFPSHAEANLFSGVGRSRRAARGEAPAPDWKGLAAAFNVPEERIGAEAQTYRQQVMDAVKDLEGGVTVEAPAYTPTPPQEVQPVEGPPVDVPVAPAPARPSSVVTPVAPTREEALPSAPEGMIRAELGRLPAARGFVVRALNKGGKVAGEVEFPSRAAATPTLEAWKRQAQENRRPPTGPVGPTVAPRAAVVPPTPRPTAPEPTAAPPLPPAEEGGWEDLVQATREALAEEEAPPTTPEDLRRFVSDSMLVELDGKELARMAEALGIRKEAPPAIPEPEPEPRPEPFDRVESLDPVVRRGLDTAVARVPEALRDPVKDIVRQQVVNLETIASAENSRNYFRYGKDSMGLRIPNAK
ncbi:MAG: hypothetical protein AAB368_10890, partial [bacterium]